MSRVGFSNDPGTEAELQRLVERITRAEVDSFPVGAITLYAGLVAPKNYLLCDGSTYPINEYTKLFNVLERRGGTPVPNNDTLFRVPNISDYGFPYIIRAK